MEVQWIRPNKKSTRRMQYAGTVDQLKAEVQKHGLPANEVMYCFDGGRKIAVIRGK